MKTKKLKVDAISVKHIGYVIISMKLLLIGFFLITLLPTLQINDIHVESSFFWFIAAGFVAQLIDGALGMAYGVSCSSLLLYLGLPPKIGSASVHIAEVFTTGVSGLSHLHFGNFDKKLFFRLVFTGVGGAMLGAYLISEIFDGKMIKPYISTYLLILGVVIIFKAVKYKIKDFVAVKYAEPLAFVGGLMDAIGGGGWGPIVTSNLINQGNDPKETIGTVNTAEFFVTFFSTGVFLFFVGIDSWPVVVALIIGGVLAAPLGAMLAAKLERRTIMLLVGFVIIVTSLFNIYKSLA